MMMVVVVVVVAVEMVVVVVVVEVVVVVVVVVEVVVVIIYLDRSSLYCQQNVTNVHSAAVVCSGSVSATFHQSLAFRTQVSHADHTNRWLDVMLLQRGLIHATTHNA